MNYFSVQVFFAFSNYFEYDLFFAGPNYLAYPMSRSEMSEITPTAVEESIGLIRVSVTYFTTAMAGSRFVSMIARRKNVKLKRGTVGCGIRTLWKP